MSNEFAALEDQVEDLLERLDAAEARARTVEGALRLIADRTYPATYVGRRDDGVEMYGDAGDATRFAQSVLDSLEQTS